MINGDATTENLAPFLTGYSVKFLPEARSWKPKKNYLNRWPFIFKDLHKQNYKTVYAEDDPNIGGFHYRLTGFNEKPTDKYLLPWFRYTRRRNAYDCSVKYSFRYLRDFFKTYSSENKFALMVFSILGHDEMNQVHLADSDVIDFLKFLKESKFKENTTVLIFGDHGYRTGRYRGTMKGKLEERLPFLSITLPPSYRKSYPRHMKNLRSNSEILTSHFDVYQTLRHIISLSNNTQYTRNRKIGNSLFTDITSLNRTCEDCGVPIHYCPCLQSTVVSTKDINVITVSHYVVTHINNMIANITKARKLCNKLVLGEIIHASLIETNRKVQTFDDTYETKECDRCGIKVNNNFKPPSLVYSIIISVKPSAGKFEASVEYDIFKRKASINSDISRINLYGDQPKCVAKEYPHLRKYCHCKK